MSTVTEPLPVRQVQPARKPRQKSTRTARVLLPGLLRITETTATGKQTADLEAVRAAVRQRLGLDDADPRPAALEARPTSEAAPEPAGPAPHRNGRRAKATA
jgi:hypothetical protein